MPQRVYASASDYEAAAEDPFDGDESKLSKRLRAASVEVEKLTRLAVYDTDDDGYPTDQDIADAFTEATCAIVEHWADTDDPRGTDAVQGAVKILSVSLGTTSSSTENLSARDKLARRIGERAFDVLTNAGLIGSAVSHT
jgi:hypothetical protein